jgi:hypothetical protein
MSVCFLVVLDCRSNLEDALSRRGTQQPSHLHVSHYSGENFYHRYGYKFANHSYKNSKNC